MDNENCGPECFCICDGEHTIANCHHCSEHVYKDSPNHLDDLEAEALLNEKDYLEAEALLDMETEEWGGDYPDDYPGHKESKQ